jgi:hypothetical protein
MQNSFATWTGAPNATLPVTQGANTSVNCESCAQNTSTIINLICFTCSDTDFTKDDQTLAVTLFRYVTGSGQSDGHGGTTRFAGQMIKADILFNPSTSFTTNSAAGTGDPVDLQTVATHEIGHFFGLDHSAVTNSVMFPFAANQRLLLAYDDVAAISTVYPKSTPDVQTGKISGTVRFASTGAGVFGAHVFADSVTSATPFSSAIRKGPIGTLTAPDGTYTITGLPQDSYTITAEPLDGPVTEADVSDYPGVFGQSAVQTNFTTRQH